MSIDKNRVHLALANGVSIVCGTCTHFWVAADKQLNNCGQKCGGPMSGGTFEKYSGPITDFSAICFVCGSKSTHAVRAKDSMRVLGCCDKHIDIVKKWKPIDKPAVDIITISKDGTKLVDKDVAEPISISLKLE
jgi:hypothetical protein